MTLDLDNARDVAVAAAEAAGKLLRDATVGAADGVRSRQKDHTGDIVTELDLAAEQLIVTRLRVAFPEHAILAEESGRIGPTGDDRPFWLVDPLDGTNNVAIGLPAFVVGLALCIEGRPVVGVVHEPISERTWSAIRGRGARGPGGPLVRADRADQADGAGGANPATTPDRRVVAWTQGYSVSRRDPAMLALRHELERTSRRVLQLWTPLLCWVMLARGDIDGFVGYLAETIDLPAGVLIAAEAGIDVRDLKGEPFDPVYNRSGTTYSFVAAAPASVAELAETVAWSRIGHADPPSP